MKKAAALLLCLILVFSMTSCVSLLTINKVLSSSKLEADSSDEIKEIESQNDAADSGNFESETIDNDYCSVTATGVEIDEYWGYTVKVLLENKTEDKNYMYTVEYAAINGVNVSASCYSTVAPGKKTNDRVTFTDYFLEEQDIGEYTDIELTFRVYDNDDWSADDVVKETIHVYPKGKKNAQVFEREIVASDTVIVDNEYVTLIVTEYITDNEYEYAVNTYLVNKTDKNLIFTSENESVNGFMMRSLFYEDLRANHVAFESMSWSKEELEDNNITDVDEIKFTLRVYDNDSWIDDEIINETFKLNP